MLKRNVFLIAAVLGGCALPLMADEMQYAGTTSGSFTDATAATVLSFTGTGFGPAFTSGGSATLSNLGTFTVNLLSSPGSVSAAGSFDLTVNFTIPGGTSSFNPITAAVTGTINQNTANNVLIDFGPGQLITFSNGSGSGSFLLTINDVSFPTPTKVSGATQTLTGTIENAVFDSTSSTTVVPEPGSISLLSTFTFAAGFALYRRRRRGNIR